MASVHQETVREHRLETGDDWNSVSAPVRAPGRLAAIRARLLAFAVALLALLPADALARAGGGSHSFSSGGGSFGSRGFGRGGGGFGGGHHFFFFGGGGLGGGGGLILIIILIVVGYLIYRAVQKSRDDRE